MLSSGQLVFDLQLQPNSDFFEYKIFLLCADNTNATLTVQLELTFNVFLLKIFCRGFSFGKCLFTSLKNIFPTFVFTFNENGGLNHITFLLRFFFSGVSQPAVLVLYINLSLKPLFLSASEYIGIELQKMFSSDEMSDIYGGPGLP